MTQVRLPARGVSIDTIAWRGIDGRISVDRSVAAALGLPAVTDSVVLEEIEGVRVSEDAAAAAVIVSCTGACLSTQHIGAGIYEPPSVERAWGGYVNYDLAAQWLESGAPTLSGIVQAASFGPFGMVESTWLAQTGAAGERLQTRWTFDAPAQRLRLQIGDGVIESAHGAPRAFAGLQIGQSFALTPAVSTQPAFILSGEAEHASTLELYVDGVLRARAQVEAGPFAVESAPSISGAGAVRAVLTDALGREQIIERPFFAAPALLRKGLSEWSFAAGAQREGWRGNSYGAAFGAARYRAGVTEGLSIEAGADLSREGFDARFAVAAADIRVGQVSAAYASGETHTTREIGWLYDSRRWSAHAHWRQSDGARSAQAAALGLRLDLGRGQLSFSAAQIDPIQAARLQTLSLEYRPDLRVGDLTFRITSDGRGAGGLSFGLAFSTSLNGSASAGLSAEYDRGGGAYRLGAQRPAPSGGGVGWRTRVSTGAQQRLDLALAHRGALGESAAQAVFTEAGERFRFDHAGALGLIEGHAFASRSIREGFALVDVGAAGVQVRRDRLPIGRTGADGRVLAQGLRAYDRNQITLDVDDLPRDRVPARREAFVTPAYGAGAVVRFVSAMHEVQESRVRLAAGEAPARGDVLVRARDGARFPVGSAGRVVLNNAEEGDVVRLESAPTCRGAADAAALSRGIVLTCAAAS